MGALVGDFVVGAFVGVWEGWFVGEGVVGALVGVCIGA